MMTDKEIYKKLNSQIITALITVIALTVLITTVKSQSNIVRVDTWHNPVAAVKKEPDTTEKNDIEIVQDKINTDDLVTVYLENAGRSDPFLPPDDYEQVAALNDLLYYMTPPPEKTGDNTEVSELVKTKVSGIMYDNSSPAAILNIDGSDYLVKSGETINNYKILAISPSTVTVQLGTNTFKAGVGQMFSDDDMNYMNDSFGSERKAGF